MSEKLLLLNYSVREREIEDSLLVAFDDIKVLTVRIAIVEFA
jgi:hypothetical protein